MWIFLDIFVVAVIVIFALFGAKRGAVRAVISLAITVAAAVIAISLSKPVASSVYDGYVKNEIIAQVQGSLESVDLVPAIKDGIKENLGVEINDSDIERIAESDDIFTEIQDIASDYGEDVSAEELNEKWSELVSSDSIEEIVGDSVPAEIVDSITETIQESRGDIETVIKAVCASDSEAAALQIEESLVRDQATFIIRGIAALVVFIGVCILLRIIYFILSKLKIIPAIKRVSAVAGLIIGIAEGALVMIVIGMCISYIIDNSYGILTYLGQDIIDKTILFRHFI